MPGIVGIITQNADTGHAQQQLTTMLGCMLHEPFYTHGAYHAPEIGCHIGWVSHTGSYSDCNPIVSASRDVVLIFSGEHFTHGTQARGAHTGESGTSARDLLGLYEEKGESFLLDVNGWFAGVLVDRRKKTAILFNDRFGVHRIYFTERNDGFVFASEAKSVLAVSPENRQLDDAALGQFLSFGTVFQNRTLFSNVHLLPGGSSWRFNGQGSPRKGQYFKAEVWENQPVQREDVFYEALRENVSRILPQYFRANTRAAVSLTGGLDTRIIMAGRPDLDEPTPCYTYGGVYRDCYDVGAAADVAAASGQPHQVIPLGRNFFDDFATFAERTVWLTDGCLDICGSHELYYSQRAREIAPIRITGNYGSEVLRSVSTFKGGLPSSELFSGDLKPHCEAALSEHAGVRAGHEVSFAAMKEIPWHLFGRLAVAQSQLVVRSPYMDNELVSLVYRASPELRKTSALSLRLIADLNPRLPGIETDMALGGNATPLVGYPRRWYRYATFKAEWYYNLGMTPFLSQFDRVLLKKLEPLFLGYHKIDHYRIWFRDQLAGYIRDTLSDRAIATRPYVKAGACQKLVGTNRITGRYVSEVSKLITLELVQRLFLSSQPRPQRATYVFVPKMAHGTSSRSETAGGKRSRSST